MSQTLADGPVGFIGLGKLGAPIARNLVTSGVPLTASSTRSARAAYTSR